MIKTIVGHIIAMILFGITLVWTFLAAALPLAALIAALYAHSDNLLRDLGIVTMLEIILLLPYIILIYRNKND